VQLRWKIQVEVISLSEARCRAAEGCTEQGNYAREMRRAKPDQGAALVGLEGALFSNGGWWKLLLPPRSWRACIPHDPRPTDPSVCAS
jgi:hypothetical protein